MRAYLLLFVPLGCGGNAISSRLEIERDDADSGGVATARGTWTYLSAEVDVTATLLSERSDDRCSTTAKLTVNEATASPVDYRLDETDCSVLALTEGGDIVLYGLPTGHDWSPESLRVDTDAERIELGPWTPSVPNAPSYLFTLAAPPCGGDCTCPYLQRRAGNQDLVLELGRKCD